MKKCILILPYFGHLPPSFSLFLYAFSFNKDFDLLVFTNDNSKFEIPKNVVIEHMSFEDIKKKFFARLGSNICLNTPYKLCDYKPTYGYIFHDYIKDYEYWGHCDCDLIFGDLAPILRIMDEGYEKIFSAGHLTIYKNTDMNNKLFLKKLDGKPVFKNASSSNEIFGFDEDFFIENIHSIFIQERKKIYSKDLSFNCNTSYYNFKRSFYDPESRRWITDCCFSSLFWEDGHLYGFDKKEKEYIYFHFQGRTLKCNLLNAFSSIAISPSGFYCKRKTIKRHFFFFSFLGVKYFLRRLKYSLLCKKEINPRQYRNRVSFLQNKE